MTKQADERSRFNGLEAADLARQLPGTVTRVMGLSERFAIFGDDDRLVLIAGQQEAEKVGLALGLGLAARGTRRLVLVLPASRAFATRQRLPWLTEEARPELWLHSNLSIEEAPPWSQQDTVDHVTQWASTQNPQGPEAELHRASTPLHLQERSRSIEDLVEWATSHPQLDAAHRQGERSWHCAGQKVLSVQATASHLRIRAGIHDRERMKDPDATLGGLAPLDPHFDQVLRGRTEAAIQSRLSEGGPFHKPDEHWFQSILRRDPSLVGIESPALREVPAWRPRAKDHTFGRGYLDLMGLDGHGDIRLVEAKLASSDDDMTMMQGIDYRVWAQAYREGLAEKLSAPKHARLRLHFAIGAMNVEKKLLHPRVAEQVPSIDTEALPFRFHVVTGWFNLTPPSRGAVKARAFPDNALPTDD